MAVNVMGIIVFLLGVTAVAGMPASGSHRTGRLTDHSAFVGAEIINGTVTRVKHLDNNFLYCRISNTEVANLHRYRVEWRDPEGYPIPGWNRSSQRYTVGCTKHVPSCYLVLEDVDDRVAGRYTCRLYFKNRNLLNTSTIQVNVERRSN